MKNRLVIEAGTELRIPSGKMQGWTLTALDGPTVTITVNSAPLSVGDTVGAGEVIITRAADGSSNDTWVEFDDGEAGGEPGPAGPKGDTGATGPTGATGRGIASIAVNAGHLTGTYSDGTAWDAGTLPAGTGGGLDAEAVQDILGAMLGETQGHYDDAAGTYTISLPAGGGGGSGTLPTLLGTAASLIPGDLSGEAWRGVNPNAAPLVQAAAGDGTAYLVNPRLDAPATAYLASALLVPAGVTRVAMTLRASAPTAQTVALELVDVSSNISFGVEAVNLTDTASTTTYTRDVTPGHTLHARLHVNGGSATAQARPTVEGLRVTPVDVQAGSFWVDFRRVEALPSVLHNFVSDEPMVGGVYQPGTPYTSLILDTEAGSIGVECWNQNAPTHYRPATVLVNGQYHATVQNAAQGLNTTLVTLPAGQKRVEVRSGGQEGTILSNLAGTYLRAVYVPGATRAQVVPPPGTVDVVVLGDSNTAGSPGMTRAGVEAWSQRLKPRWSVQAETISVSGLYTWALAPGGLERLARRLTALRPQVIIIAHSNNDWAVGPAVDSSWTATRFGAEYGTLLDLLARLSPASTVLAMTSTSVRSDPSPEPYRAAIRAAVGTRPWVTLIDGPGLLNMSDVESDGVHITSGGAAKIARHISAILGGSGAGSLPPVAASSTAPVLLSSGLTRVAGVGAHQSGTAGSVASFALLIQANGMVTFKAVRLAIKAGSAQNVRVTVRASDASAETGAVLVSGPPVAQDGTMRVQTFALPTAITTTAGAYYLLQFDCSDGSMSPGQDLGIAVSTPQSGDNITWLGGAWGGSARPFSGGNGWYNTGIELLNGIPKGVTGPLDPVDFPRSTVDAAPSASGFMLVNDSAKTASLYWKFSDGSTKKVDLA